MRVLLVEAPERLPTGGYSPVGTSKDSQAFVRLVKDAFVACGVSDAVVLLRGCNDVAGATLRLGGPFAPSPVAASPGVRCRRKSLECTEGQVMTQRGGWGGGSRS